ncbi:uncharacterized protein LOC142229220 [Haematobia irritans]|uniref:uncharacterized protein LOC142229220 n=1 Tax=Haematobia irritans TaxID=7368 RepID=UPI003F4F8458
MIDKSPSKDPLPGHHIGRGPRIKITSVKDKSLEQPNDNKHSSIIAPHEESVRSIDDISFGERSKNIEDQSLEEISASVEAYSITDRSNASTINFMALPKTSNPSQTFTSYNSGNLTTSRNTRANMGSQSQQDKNVVSETASAYSTNSSIENSSQTLLATNNSLPSIEDDSSQQRSTFDGRARVINVLDIQVNNTSQRETSNRPSHIPIASNIIDYNHSYRNTKHQDQEVLLNNSAIFPESQTIQGSNVSAASNNSQNTEFHIEASKIPANIKTSSNSFGNSQQEDPEVFGHHPEVQATSLSTQESNTSSTNSIHQKYQSSNNTQSGKVVSFDPLAFPQKGIKEKTFQDPNRLATSNTLNIQQNYESENVDYKRKVSNDNSSLETQSEVSAVIATSSTNPLPAQGQIQDMLSDCLSVFNKAYNNIVNLDPICRQPSPNLNIINISTNTGYHMSEENVSVNDISKKFYQNYDMICEKFAERPEVTNELLTASQDQENNRTTQKLLDDPSGLHSSNIEITSSNTATTQDRILINPGITGLSTSKISIKPNNSVEQRKSSTNMTKSSVNVLTIPAQSSVNCNTTEMLVNQSLGFLNQTDSRYSHKGNRGKAKSIIGIGPHQDQNLLSFQSSTNNSYNQKSNPTPICSSSVENRNARSSTYVAFQATNESQGRLNQNDPRYSYESNGGTAKNNIGKEPSRDQNPSSFQSSTNNSYNQKSNVTPIRNRNARSSTYVAFQATNQSQGRLNQNDPRYSHESNRGTAKNNIGKDPSRDQTTSYNQKSNLTPIRSCCGETTSENRNERSSIYVAAQVTQMGYADLISNHNLTSVHPKVTKRVARHCQPFVNQIDRNCPTESTIGISSTTIAIQPDFTINSSATSYPSYNQSSHYIPSHRSEVKVSEELPNQIDRNCSTESNIGILSATAALQPEFTINSSATSYPSYNQSSHYIPSHRSEVNVSEELPNQIDRNCPTESNIGILSATAAIQPEFTINSSVTSYPFYNQSSNYIPSHRSEINVSEEQPNQIDSNCNTESTVGISSTTAAIQSEFPINSSATSYLSYNQNSNYTPSPRSEVNVSEEKPNQIDHNCPTESNIGILSATAAIQPEFTINSSVTSYPSYNQSSNYIPSHRSEVNVSGEKPNQIDRNCPTESTVGISSTTSAIQPGFTINSSVTSYPSYNQSSNYIPSHRSEVNVSEEKPNQIDSNCNTESTVGISSTTAAIQPELTINSSVTSYVSSNYTPSHRSDADVSEENHRRIYSSSTAVNSFNLLRYEDQPSNITNTTNTSKVSRLQESLCSSVNSNNLYPSQNSSSRNHSINNLSPCNRIPRISYYQNNDLTKTSTSTPIQDDYTELHSSISQRDIQENCSQDIEALTTTSNSIGNKDSNHSITHQKAGIDFVSLRKISHNSNTDVSDTDSDEPVGIFAGGEFHREENSQSSREIHNEDFSTDDDMPLANYNEILKPSAVQENSIAIPEKPKQIKKNFYRRNVKRLRTVKDYDEYIAAWRPNLECVVCKETLRTYSLLLKHFEDKHPTEKCHIQCCQVNFYYRYEIEKHIHYHKEPFAFKCDICFKCYTTKDIFQDHLLTHAGQAKIYKCPKCQKEFTNLWLQRRHINLCCPPQDSLYVCKECGRRCPTKYVLKKHTCDNQYRCKICDKSFRKHADLVDHMYFHSGQVCATCQYCGVSFKSRRYFYEHLNKHHPEEWQREKNEKAELRKIKIKKTYKCGRCDNVYQTPLAWQEHQAVHEGKMQYSCSLCSKTYKYSSNLAAHFKRVHPIQHKKKMQEKMEMMMNT